MNDERVPPETEVRTAERLVGGPSNGDGLEDIPPTYVRSLPGS